MKKGLSWLTVSVEFQVSRKGKAQRQKQLFTHGKFFVWSQDSYITFSPKKQTKLDQNEGGAIPSRAHSDIPLLAKFHSPKCLISTQTVYPSMDQVTKHNHLGTFESRADCKKRTGLLCSRSIKNKSEIPTTSYFGLLQKVQACSIYIEKRQQSKV